MKKIELIAGLFGGLISGFLIVSYESNNHDKLIVSSVKDEITIINRVVKKIYCHNHPLSPYDNDPKNFLLFTIFPRDAYKNAISSGLLSKLSNIDNVHEIYMSVTEINYIAVKVASGKYQAHEGVRFKKGVSDLYKFLKLSDC